MKKVIKVLIVSLLLIVQTGCKTEKTFDNDIDLYDEIRNNTLSKDNYTIYNECKAYNYYSREDVDREGSGEMSLQKTIVVEGDKKLIQDTLVRDDYDDTFYIIEYGDKVYDQKNNTYIEDRDLFYEIRGYFLPEKYLLEKENIVNVDRIDDNHIKIEFNEKVNELAEDIVRSYLLDAPDGPKLTRFEVTEFTLSYTSDYLLDGIKMDVNIYFDVDNNNGSLHNIYVQVKGYDEVDLPITEEDATIKPERQYFSMGYVDKEGNLISNDMVHPGQNIAIAYFSVQFADDEFDLNNPYGIVKLLDCSNMSLEDYNNGKTPIEYSLNYIDNTYVWTSNETGETYPYLYHLEDEFFILQLNGRDYYFGLENFQYTNQ